MKSRTDTPEYFALLLRQSGHKATPGRLSLLQVLAKAEHPLTISEIALALEAAGGNLNQATLYRALEALLDVNIVRRIDMQHAHAHYELTSDAKHHHHLICKRCGRIEDVAHCEIDEIERTILKKSKGFVSIHTHSLEFFGYCKKCAVNGKKLIP